MRRVLITGAGRGLGLEFARQCLNRGDRVFAGVRTPETAESIQALKAEHKDRLTMVRLEVTDPASIAASLKGVNKSIDGLDVLINNAGINENGRDAGSFVSHMVLGHLHPERMLGMFRVNAIAPLMIAQGFLDLLKAGKSPRIVNISSKMGSLTHTRSGGNYTYPASKAALNMLMRALAFDVIGFGIVAVVIAPGWVQTDMGGSAAPLTPERSVHGVLQVIDNLTERDAGRFFEWNGKECTW
jgi:NAD(P)-dependent dehydrogenase (short-subunit alcohol dehydrogenase family)